jgi:hypothetical protein
MKTWFPHVAAPSRSPSASANLTSESVLQSICPYSPTRPELQPLLLDDLEAGTREANTHAGGGFAAAAEHEDGSGLTDAPDSLAPADAAAADAWRPDAGRRGAAAADAHESSDSSSCDEGPCPEIALRRASSSPSPALLPSDRRASASASGGGLLSSWAVGSIHLPEGAADPDGAWEGRDGLTEGLPAPSPSALSALLREPRRASAAGLTDPAAVGRTDPAPTKALPGSAARASLRSWHSMPTAWQVRRVQLTEPAASRRNAMLLHLFILSRLRFLPAIRRPVLSAAAAAVAAAAPSMSRPHRRQCCAVRQDVAQGTMASSAMLNATAVQMDRPRCPVCRASSCAGAGTGFRHTRSAGRYCQSPTSSSPSCGAGRNAGDGRTDGHAGGRAVLLHAFGGQADGGVERETDRQTDGRMG